MAGKVTERKRVILDLIAKLKNKSIDFYGVPEEYRYDKQIVKTQRNLGLRKSAQRGYDVLYGLFFVTEIVITENYSGDKISHEETIGFSDFASYYKFLQGDIYENACYYQYEFSQTDIDKYSIDLNKINHESLIDYTIDDFTIGFSQEELRQYELKESQKNLLIKEIEKLDTCKTYVEFRDRLKSAVDEFAKIFSGYSITQKRQAKEFFLFNYVLRNKDKAFDFVMEYINKSSHYGFEINLCLIYPPQDVVVAYDNRCYEKQTAEKYKKQLSHFAEYLEQEKATFIKKSYFDEQTHFFVSRLEAVTANGNTVAELIRYFQTFEELAEYLEFDLSNCDFSKAILHDMDLSKYKINDSTILPVQYQTNLTYSLKKTYDSRKDCFIVEQKWTNKDGKTVKSYPHTFKFFFDFVHFLKGDLSNADLLFCSGLGNLHSVEGINFDNANLRSYVCDKFCIKYDTINVAATTSFSSIEKNERKSNQALIAKREALNLSYEEQRHYQKIYYVSDLHLLHRIENFRCKSDNDIAYVIQKVVDNLLASLEKYATNIVLIGGDVASEFSVFKQFISMLRETIDYRKLRIRVIFTLGNHELWNFPTSSFDEIVEKYNQVITEHGMYLLQNNIIYIEDEIYGWQNNVTYIADDGVRQIDTTSLKTLSQTELRKRLSKARIILFGGLGFSGYNEKFNANMGIYRDTINRQQEIQETHKFEELYKRVCADLSDKNVIVFTHMPQENWCSDATPHNGFVYVNGHTHRNYFYDDGSYRIYADNQIGYKHELTRLKYFYFDCDYELFVDYEDGIYEITREDYIDFYRGKNLSITFNRNFCKLFMLKKDGYYMFLLQNAKGKLQILNGGNVKGLAQNDVNYYFDRMDSVIATIKTPLDKLTAYQQKIANVIKSIGGSGTIHGAIVDIDYFNHIYVNPLDLTTTPYFAWDIVHKEVFPDTPALLQSNCPALYANYLKLIESNTSNALELQDTKNKINKVGFYFDTDIYRASREIHKMQKLSSNILSVWGETSVKKLSGDSD